MKAFVTGVDGFIGSHLTELLLAKGVKVSGITHEKGLKNTKHLSGKIRTTKCDVNDRKNLEKVVMDARPDYIFHLAAQSFVMPSWEDPEGTMKTNTLGTLNLFEAVKKAEIDPVIVVACSSAQYGMNYENEIPIKETKEFRPSSPYAVSKVGTDMLCYLYWLTYGMRTIRARIFNTIGPRKTGSAVADFAMMIAEAEKGKKSTIAVGNLESTIDLTDVRDNVRALWLLAKKGVHGDAYNICTGKGHKVSDVLKKMIAYSDREIKVTTDEKKIRPKEDPIFIGDNTKIRKLGWKPNVKLEDTLKDTLDYWRNKV